MKKHFSLHKRLRALEQRSKLSRDKQEQEDFAKLYDLDLMTAREWTLISISNVINDIGVRLGYGRFMNGRHCFDRSADPYLNDEIMERCFAAATGEEIERLDLQAAIYEKNKRLTVNLTDEEKDLIKRHNHIVMFFNNSIMQAVAKQGYSKGHTKDELEEAKLLYRQLMAKYGEQIYEDHPMEPYISGSGIPMDMQEKTDSNSIH